MKNKDCDNTIDNILLINTIKIYSNSRKGLATITRCEHNNLSFFSHGETIHMKNKIRKLYILPQLCKFTSLKAICVVCDLCFISFNDH